MVRKISTLSLFLIIAGINIKAQAPAFNWAKAHGSTNNETGESIVTDANGNVYTAGFFEGTVDFDPGPGVFNLTASSSFAMYVCKLDASGNFEWAAEMGMILNGWRKPIVLDANGNVYLTGFFWGTVDFDPGPGTYNLSSLGSSAFVCKLDENGNFIWVKNVSEGGNCRGYSINLDQLGNIYTTGVFTHTSDFDPGPGIYNLTSNGSYDVFISKLDSSGNLIWVKGMGDDGGGEEISYTAIDALGNIYLTGSFDDTVDFDPGPGIYELYSNGSDDIFIWKLDVNGNFVWVKQQGGSNFDPSYDICLDMAGNIYTCGFNSGGDLDPGPGIYSLLVGGFISKLDNNGNFIWAKQFQLPGGGTYIYTLDLDASDNLYTGGKFVGTADFDPGPGTYNLTASGTHDGFICKLDNAGNFDWAVSVGGGSSTDINSVTADIANNVLVTGQFKNTGDFDPGPGTFNINSLGGDDAFVLKLGDNCYPATSTDIQTACDSYTWINGITYTSSNNTATYAIAGGSSTGCDSLVTLNLTINSSTNSTDVQSACDSYMWIDGNTYTTNNNTATHTLTNSHGCDSVVTLNLTINYSNSGTDVQSACNTYTWIDGNTYTTNNNTATHTLTNSHGCDSVVTLNLTITNIDTGITQAGFQLTSNQPGATYQWIDCDNNNTPVSGASLQSFTPAQNGHYAVVIGLNGCTDTTGCKHIFGMGIDDNSTDQLTIFPNPTDNYIQIISTNIEIQSFGIYNSLGQLITTGTFNQTALVNLLLYPAGIYYLQANNKNYKIIKN